MSAPALALVLTAAVLHAVWNILAKRARGGVAFIWLTFAISTMLYIPVVVVASALAPPRFTFVDAAFIGGNGVLHVIYFVLLRRGYAAGDLSLVYPIARGTGPLLAALIAVALLGERPDSFGALGLTLIVAGIFASAGGDGTRVERRSARISVIYGIMTGVAIATYTVWDAYSVTTLAIAPIVYDFWGNVVRTIVLSPLVARRGAEVRDAWRRYPREAIGIAILSPAAYLLVLWALATTPVSAVAPAREISIVVGTFFGVRFFGERAGRRRVAGSILMFLGIVAIAVR